MIIALPLLLVLKCNRRVPGASPREQRGGSGHSRARSAAGGGACRAAERGPGALGRCGFSRLRENRRRRTEIC